MALFGKKEKRIIEVGGKKIELEPKPSKSIFGGKKPPQKGEPQQQNPASPAAPTGSGKLDFDLGQKPEKPAPKFTMPKFMIGGPKGAAKPKRKTQLQFDVGPLKTEKLEFPQSMSPEAAAAAQELSTGSGAKAPVKATRLSKFLQKQLSKQKGLTNALREQGIQVDPYQFVRRMFFASVILAVVLGITSFVLFSALGLTTIECALFGVLMGIVVWQAGFNTFLMYPLQKSKKTSKNVERDIIFAARDMIISLRSGMPLFNAIASVSKGYGDASNEFAKIVDKVQLGMPLEEAIDDTIANTKSNSFRRIMLQASVSIKAGADVVGALQSIIDQLSQERIIELRSYGQKLNAIAMFYMLFGVIMPSMGIAVVTILTTFISLFTVDVTVFEFVLVGMVALQLIFLKLITGSRPVFSM